jgi:hypothetical protein
MAKKKKRATPAKSDYTELYVVVGELVMIANAVDHLLNQLVIEALHLEKSPMLEPVVATLDPRQKIEILKSRAKLINSADWKKGITGFCGKADALYRQRNIVCHTPAYPDGDTWTFKPIAAAKLLNRLDLEKKALSEFPFDDTKAAIATGEAALGTGVDLLDNLKRLQPWLSKRRAQTPPISQK